MRLRDIEHSLSAVQPFRRPRVELEQYATCAHIAARIAVAAAEHLCDEFVLDLGCGCGMLSAAAVFGGASLVLGVDIDAGALEQALENVERAGVRDHVDLVRADAADVPRMFRLPRIFGAAVTNPPFGTKNNAGIDVLFLRIAAQMCADAVYSLHKTSTRAFVVRQAKAAAGARGDAAAIAALRFEISRQFRFHKQASVDVEVDLVRTIVGSGDEPDQSDDSFEDAIEDVRALSLDSRG